MEIRACEPAGTNQFLMKDGMKEHHIVVHGIRGQQMQEQVAHVLAHSVTAAIHGTCVEENPHQPLPAFASSWAYTLR